ncbi:hypothetical protein NEOLEDRAFT_1081480, partial [Neolentinus lepideus HHB14362 ss-1]
IHAAIDEWSSGQYVPCDFSGNALAQMYEIHIEMLQHVRDVAPANYRRTMADLFREAK